MKKCDFMRKAAISDKKDCHLHCEQSTHCKEDFCLEMRKNIIYVTESYNLTRGRDVLCHMVHQSGDS